MNLKTINITDLVEIYVKVLKTMQKLDEMTDENVYITTHNVFQKKKQIK